ncbi:response regulator [Litorivicinus lipolyticus]|uniref:Response regulator n=1 Tax=Litorivicinus lipolyticus TaxID=418701 RepID=A0A5Q2Q736_9GAMM|nr:response regulator transcription factor [Litorivicinus lipolyticus]QGG80179.1 response regulator [Litorivicinus lipolyticus]
MNIMVLEDDRTVAARFERILGEWSQAQAVISFQSLGDGMAALKSTSVDLLIADIHLPDGSGIEAIQYLSDHQPDAKAVVISALSDRRVVIDAIRAGAIGYLLKDDDVVEIIRAIESILAGGSPISTAIARYVVESVQARNVTVGPNNKGTLLTSREVEVITAISKGYTNAEVATMLAISPHTVPVHIRNIYRKLDTRNRSEATSEARRLGILE